MVNRKIQPVPGIRAHLVAALDERWEVFLAQLRRSRRRCTERSIHDLRVATRRMIAALDAAGTLLPGGAPGSVRRRLRRLLKGFNALRDVHIQLLYLNGLRLKFPLVAPFLTTLREREGELVRNAAAAIGKLETRAMEQEIARVAQSLTVLSAEPEAEAASLSALFGAVASAFARSFSLRKQVVPGEPASIHALRVAFKNLRYTVEVLAPLLPGFRKTHFKAMNAYQTRMGEIQDLVIVGKALTMDLPGRHPALPASLLPVHQLVMQHRTECIEAFMRDADELLTFWHLILGSTDGTLHPSPWRGRPARKRGVPER